MAERTDEAVLADQIDVILNNASLTLLEIDTLVQAAAHLRAQGAEGKERRAVAWMVDGKPTSNRRFYSVYNPARTNAVPLYLHPPEPSVAPEEESDNG